MRRRTFLNLSTIIFSLNLVFSFVVACGSNAVAQTSSGAVFKGDYPDPSVIRVGSTYWSVGTSSAWAPAFPIMKSSDLANWQPVGAVFTNPPAWTVGEYWAPEISQMDGHFFIYYAAQSKSSKTLCVAVATAEQPQGPYSDHGPIICQPMGSIDPAPVVDDNGDKYLIWKEDGNSQNKTAIIYAQRLTDDGLKLQGTKSQLIHNDTPWEGGLVEAPYVLKRNGYWYMFYAANGCCGLQCNYAVGVARAKSILGPWLKNPANPILKSNNSFKCPGHGSIVQDTQGRDVFVYHAYSAAGSVYVGRQAMADQVDWSAAGEGWPSINGGNGPSEHAGGFLGSILQSREINFHDSFKSLDSSWQWPAGAAPQMFFKPGGGLILKSSSSSQTQIQNQALLARSTHSANYVTTVSLVAGQLSAQTSAGLSVYGNALNLIGVSYQAGRLQLWTRKNGAAQTLVSFAAPALKSPDGSLQIRVVTTAGHYFKFFVSADNSTWTAVGSEIDGAFLPPWDLGVRIALFVNAPLTSQDGAQAEFSAFDTQATN